MDQQIGKKVSDQLLAARQESLEQLKFGAIRAHGKLWGMDVFSWPNPSIELVATTIESFPFPVVWIGNKAVFDWCIEHQDSVWTNVRTVIATDEPRMVLTHENFVHVENVYGSETLEDSLLMMKGMQLKGGVLLFTATDSEWERNHQAFVDFIALHQIK